jgi:hypothetical protein
LQQFFARRLRCRRGLFGRYSLFSRHGLGRYFARGYFVGCFGGRLGDWLLAAGALLATLALVLLAGAGDAAMTVLALVLLRVLGAMAIGISDV